MLPYHHELFLVPQHRFSLRLLLSFIVLSGFTDIDDYYAYEHIGEDKVPQHDKDDCVDTTALLGNHLKALLKCKENNISYFTACSLSKYDNTISAGIDFVCVYRGVIS